MSRLGDLIAASGWDSCVDSHVKMQWDNLGHYDIEVVALDVMTLFPQK